MSVRERAEKWKPKYYLKYLYLNESGDCRPYLDWEEETFEDIKDLARFISNRKRYGNNKFEDIEIMELSKFQDNDLLEQAILKDEVRYQKELKENEEWNKRIEKEEKEKEEKERYELYLKLKERYEN